MIASGSGYGAIEPHPSPAILDVAQICEAPFPFPATARYRRNGGAQENPMTVTIETCADMRRA